MTSLFRKESMQSVQTPLYAKPLAVKPVTATRIMWILLLVLAVLITFASIAQYDKKERVTGYLTTEEGDAVVLGPLSGTVTDVYVKEGSRVNKGDPLFTISTEVGSGTGESGEKTYQQVTQKKETLERDLVQIKETAKLEKIQLAQKLKSLKDSIFESKQGLVRLKAILSLSQKTLEKQQELVLKGYISELSLVDKQRDKLEIDARISAANQNILGQEREQAQLQFELNTFDQRLESTIASRQRELLSLEQVLTEMGAARTRTVTAAVSGEVVGLLLKTGTTVGSGEALFRISTINSKLIAKFRLPSRVNGTVYAGQKVLLQYDAFPYREFGQAEARITEVPTAPIEGPEQSRLRDNNAPLYLATGKINADSITSRKKEQFKLTSGMTFQADIIIERRSLLSWLFSPILDAWKA